MSKNIGGPAFPGERGHGLTIRDWFAGMAMQGLIASPRGTPNGADATDTYYAEMAYIMADAMIAEREKE